MLVNFIDPSAKVDTSACVWHYAVILAAVRLHAHVSIGSGTEIGRGSVIGEASRIGAHCFFPPNSYVGKRVFVGPGVICCDDKHPLVNNTSYNAQPPVIEDDASIGAGAILLPGVHIGRGAIIGAGAVVTRSVGAGETVVGLPARPFPESAVAATD